MLKIIVGITYFFMMLALGCFIIRGLRRNHSADVYIIFYIFSLAICSTSIIVFGAIGIGAIDQQGSPVGPMGEFIMEVMNLFLDLNKDLFFIVSCAALVIIPQALAYILSGFFGCASNIFLLESTLSMFFWSVVKTFSVTSGIIFVLGQVAYWSRWKDADFSFLFSSLSVALLSILMSFSFIWLYRDSIEVFAILRVRVPCIMNVFGKIHRLATKYRQSENDDKVI